MSMATPMDNGYKMVSERHAQFCVDHPQGVVRNEVEHFVFDPATGKGFVTVKSVVWKDRSSAVKGEPPDGEGNASMPIPGPTNFTRNSEVENAETSALGRALAMIGYHAKESLASGEEIASKDDGSPKEYKTSDPSKPASEAQIKKMFGDAKRAGIDTSTADGKKVLQQIVLSATGKHSSKQLTMGDMDKIFKTLKADDILAKVVEITGGELVEEAA
jgi:hypothetical protein